PRPLQENVVRGDRIADPPYRSDQRQQGAVRRHEVGERAAAQRGGAGAEKLLRGRIDKANDAAPIDDDYRERQSRQNHSSLGLGYAAATSSQTQASALPRRCLDHAGSRASSGSQKARISCPTRVGSMVSLTAAP